MKRTLIILGLCAMICCGCWKRGVHPDNGYDIFNSWNTSTKAILDETVNFAFISNAWINGNDSVRKRIENLYFNTNNIRYEGGDKYGIYRGTKQLLVINTGGKTIDDANANWLITRYSNYDQYYSSGIKPVFLGNYNHTQLNIRNIGNNKWSVKLDSLNSSGSAIDWIIAVPGDQTPVSLFDVNYSLSGSGVFLFDGTTNFDHHDVQSPVTMHYEIVNPLQQTTSNECKFKSGMVDIIVSKENYEDLILSAEIMTTNQWRLVYRGQESYCTFN